MVMQYALVVYNAYFVMVQFVLAKEGLGWVRGIEVTKGTTPLSVGK